MPSRRWVGLPGVPRRRMGRCRGAGEILMLTRTRVRVGVGAAAVIAGVSGVAVASSASPAPVGGKPSVAASATSRSLFDSKAVAVMAAQLGTGTDKARTVLDQIQRLAAKGSIDPSRPAFVAIARNAGGPPPRPSSALD